MPPGPKITQDDLDSCFASIKVALPKFRRVTHEIKTYVKAWKALKGPEDKLLEAIKDLASVTDVAPTEVKNVGEGLVAATQFVRRTRLAMDPIVNLWEQDMVDSIEAVLSEGPAAIHDLEKEVKGPFKTIYDNWKKAEKHTQKLQKKHPTTEMHMSTEVMEAQTAQAHQFKLYNKAADHVYSKLLAEESSRYQCLLLGMVEIAKQFQRSSYEIMQLSEAFVGEWDEDDYDSDGASDTTSHATHVQGEASDPDSDSEGSEGEEDPEDGDDADAISVATTVKSSPAEVEQTPLGSSYYKDEDVGLSDGHHKFDLDPPPQTRVRAGSVVDESVVFSKPAHRKLPAGATPLFKPPEPASDGFQRSAREPEASTTRPPQSMADVSPMAMRRASSRKESKVTFDESVKVSSREAKEKKRQQKREKEFAKQREKELRKSKKKGKDKQMMSSAVATGPTDEDYRLEYERNRRELPEQLRTPQAPRHTDFAAGVGMLPQSRAQPTSPIVARRYPEQQRHPMGFQQGGHRGRDYDMDPAHEVMLRSQFGGRPGMAQYHRRSFNGSRGNMMMQPQAMSPMRVQGAQHFDVEVIHPYRNANPAHLELQPGDTVRVEHGPQNQWCYGTCLNTMREGWFPTSHINMSWQRPVPPTQQRSMRMFGPEFDVRPAQLDGSMSGMGMGMGNARGGSMASGAGMFNGGLPTRDY
eukprot:m.85746 g.85746  ORF g.85746 m.85746 type:complete len:695 (-) comp12786_c0_seq4:1874-3958(-)